MKNIYNGNGIFINPLHTKIQYSAVLSPPPALISHCDQENYTLKFIKISSWVIPFFFLEKNKKKKKKTFIGTPLFFMY